MLLDYICRLCLVKHENPETSLLEISDASITALEAIFQIIVESKASFKICHNCNVKLLGFYQFFVSVLESQDRVWDMILDDQIVLNERPSMSAAIPAEQIMIGCEIEIQENQEPYIDAKESIPLKNASQMYQPDQAYQYCNTDSVATISNVDYYSKVQSNFIESFMQTPEDIQEPCIQYVTNHINEMPHLETHESSLHQPKALNHQIEIDSPIQNQSNTNRRKNRCDECGVWVINVSQHKRCVHDHSNNQVCPDCSTVFPNRLKLLMHKYYKHVPPRYKCNICQKPVRTKGLLKEHVYQKHMDGAYLYHCEWCKAQFNYRTSLVIHQKRLHSGQYERAKTERVAKKYHPY